MDYFSDWKKKAALTATSDADIEKAFADMASGFVENKLPALMQGDYNIGFEIVKKNDDNTRMLGVFAFRIDKSLLFAPIFFLHGEIKGPILYRCDTKSFVPATKEWASFLISSLEKKEGESSSKSRRQAMNPLVQMDRLRMTSGGREKAASYDYKSVTVPVRVHKEGPVTIPHGNCIVVFDKKSDDLTPATWNNRLPGGASILKMAAADDGTIRCVDSKAGSFWLAAKDGKLFKEASHHYNVAIEGPDGTFYEIEPQYGKLISETFFSKSAGMQIDDYWGEVAKAMEWPLRKEGALREFLAEPDFGAAATDAVVKAANASYDFAEMLATIYGSPDNFIPEHHTTTISKEAAAAASSEVGFINDISVFTKVGAAVPVDYYKDGFFLYDGRPEYEKSLVISEFPKELSVISEPGVYTVAQNDGTFIENVLALNPCNDSIFGSHLGHDAYNDFSGGRHPHRPYMLLIKDGKLIYTSEAIGIRTGEVSDYDGLAKDVSSSNIYMLIHDGNTWGPIAIFEKDTKDGVDYLQVDMKAYYDSFKSGHSFDEYFHSYRTDKFVYNKDMDHSIFDEGILGGDVRWVKLNFTSQTKPGNSFWKDGGNAKFEALQDIGGRKALDNFIFSNWKTPKVKITRHQNKEEGTREYQVEALNEVGPKLSKKAMFAKLAMDCGIDGTMCYAIMDKVDSDGSFSFYLQPHEKKATSLRLVETPLFQDEFDGDQGVSVQPIQSFNLAVHGDQQHEAPSAIGDMWNPTSLTGLPDSTVVSTDPMELRTLADVYKLPNVFEHGVIGSLANAFNATSLVDKYVARIEDGVDALGRIKFLIHWAPQDFEKAYGQEAMTNLEAQIEENFIALGDLLLDLLKKTERQRKGENSQFEKESE